MKSIVAVGSAELQGMLAAYVSARPENRGKFVGGVHLVADPAVPSITATVALFDTVQAAAEYGKQPEQVPA